MEDFTYRCGTKIIFGKGAESQAGKECRGFGKVLLHYGMGSIKKSGLYDKVVESLKKEGVEFLELHGVVPNPKLKLVREGIELCRKEDIGLILAVGGGSVIDSAKAIAAGALYDGDVWDFFSKTLAVKKALPVGAVLTIAAAGSEASTASVITDEAESRKLHASGDVLRPVFSILNPELTFTLPAYQTACGIADMLAHVIERYFSPSESVDLTDRMCEGVMRSIVRNARLVMKEPGNYDYRAEIMLAGTIAHNGVLGTGRVEDWASHMIEHELSAFYDVAHGAGLAVVLPAWMEHVSKKKPGQFVKFARNVWGFSGSDRDAVQAGIKSLKDFFMELGLPATLKGIGIGKEKIGEMAGRCTENGPLGNFVKLGRKDVSEILELALENG